MLQLLKYNRTRYVLAAIGIAIAIGVAVAPGVPRLVHVLAILAAGILGWFVFASLAAFHWMFDRSVFTRWTWLRDDLPRRPATCVQISAGPDEARAPLEQLFPTAETQHLEVFDAKTMGASALKAARQARTHGPGKTVVPSELEVPDGVAELVVVTLAAHEIQSATDQALFFAELDRVLAPGGRLVLIEHPRDALAFLAFGPGALHFRPSTRWLQLAARVGLHRVDHRMITPFIEVSHFERSARVDSSPITGE